MPASDGRWYCPTYANATSCYYIITTAVSFAEQKGNCTAKGGHLVAYNNAFEQLDVERYFTAAGTMTTDDYVYIGVEKTGNLWYWPDGRQGRALPCLQSPAQFTSTAAHCISALDSSLVRA